MSSHKGGKDPEEILRDFVRRELTVPDEIVSQKIHLAIQVYEHLKKQKRFHVERMKYGGITSGATIIPTFTSEFVLFITFKNGKVKAEQELLLCLPEVLEVFSEELRVLSAAEKNLDLSHIQILNFTSVFFSSQGHYFNLIPAQSFLEGRTRDERYVANYNRKQNLAAIQQIEDYIKITSPDVSGLVSQMYASSMCESHTLYFEDQTYLAHDLIRLCKFWNNSLEIEEFIPGRDYAISLLAVAAANTTGGSYIIQSFHCFLYQIRHFDDIECDLINPDGTIKAGVTIWKPPRPIIVDPFNPYANLVDHFSLAARNALKEFSAQTLDRLTEFEQGNCTLKDLLLPRPMKLILVKEPLLPLKNLLITIIQNKKIPDDEASPDNRWNFQTLEISTANLQLLGQRLTNMITIASSDFSPAKDVHEALQDYILAVVPSNEVNMITKLRRVFAARVKRRKKDFRHEDADATILLNYSVFNSAVVSFKWISN